MRVKMIETVFTSVLWCFALLGYFNSDADGLTIVCEMMSDDSGVAGVFGPYHSDSTRILEAISSEFQVPYILTSWKSPSAMESDYTVNFFPDASLLGYGLSEIVRSFGWKSFVILYENDDALERLQQILVLQKYSDNDKINRIVLEKLGTESDDRELLKKIEKSSLINVILDCRVEYIIPLLHQAASANMLNAFNNYFITNLDAYTLDFSELNTTANITTVKLIDDNYEFVEKAMKKMGLGDLIHYKKIKTDVMLFLDAFWFMNETLNEMGPAMMTNPISCDKKETSVSGRKLIEYVHRRVSTSPTLTGPITFDNHGHRISFNLYVVDILHETNIATWSSNNMTLQVNRDLEEELAAISSLQGTKVIVSSRLGAPYLMKRQTEDGVEQSGNARFEGYTLDLIAGVAKIIGFEFEIHLVEDGKYGNWDENNGKWNGIIGDILEKRAHLGVADLTITHERREVVDFSLPFMSLGIGILYRKQAGGDINMFEFLKPFSQNVLAYIAYSMILMSISLYFVLRLSPRDSKSSHSCNGGDSDDIWNLKNTIWVVLRSIMGQYSDCLPKGISARIAMITWWFFSTILISSYIANLVAFTNLSTLESSINSVEDLAQQSRVKYGFVDGGSTESFFRTSNYSTYQRIWSNVEHNRHVTLVRSNAEGVERVTVTRDAQYAFFMESTQIEYALETHCDLKQVGDWLDSKSYGIVMPLNAPYRIAVNRAILRMQESGELADLKTKWWKDKQDGPSCSAGNGVSDKQGLHELNMEEIEGLFLILGLGIVLSLILAILQFSWGIRRISKNRKIPYCETLTEELKCAIFFWTSERKSTPTIQSSE